MRPIRSPFALLAALCCAAALAQQTEPRIAQTFKLGASFQASPSNSDSPFLRAAEIEDWSIASSVSSLYALTFFAPGISGRASLSAFAAAPADFSFSLDQCWARATLADGWGLTFGRFELNWRDGGRWNPSDVVNGKAAWAAETPVAGRDALELLGSIPLPDFAIDVNLATAIVSELHDFGDIPAYAALGAIVYPFEFRLKAAFPPGSFAFETLPLFGASVKYSGGSLNAYADALCLFENSLAGELRQSAADSAWTEERNGQAFWTRWCLGANYAWGFSSRLLKSLSLGLEYLRQDDGLSRASGQAYFSRLESADLSTPPGLAAYAEDALLWNGRFFSLYRDYLSVSVNLGGIARRNLDASADGVVNLDDGSFAISSSLSWQPRGLFSITLSAMNYGGPSGSEGRRLPVSAKYSLAFQKSF
jgi:hypothetical protein